MSLEPVRRTHFPYEPPEPQPGPDGEPASDADAWKARGDAALEAEDYDAAIEAYFQALQHEPEHAAARYNLALVHVEQGRYADAVTLLKGVLATRPDDHEALTTLGWAQLWGGDAAEAVKTFRRALMLAPKFAPAHVGSGWAHMAESPPALGRAADAFAKAIAHQTDDPEAYYGLATVCEMRDEPRQAIPLLEDALRMWPEDLRAHDSLARLHEGLGDWETAAHHLMRLALARPGDVTLDRRIATLFSEHGAADRAAVFWRKVLRAQPDDAEALFALGRTLLASERGEEAIETWTAAVARHPEDAQALAGLGHAR